MHSNISINTLCFAPAPFNSHVEAVARLGARAISPDLDQIEEYSAARGARLIRDAGLDIATLTHRAFAFANPIDARLGRERLERTIDLASEIGAQSIIMTTGGRGDLAWPEAADRFAEAVAPCAAQARKAGIALGIEQTSHLYADASIAHRLSDSLRIADQAGISVMIDLFACWFDADIDEAIAAAAPHTALVQVSDYVFGDRGLPCRAVPGDGAIPLDRLLPAIVQAGFDGYFDLEIIGPRLQAEGVDSGLTRAGLGVGRLLSEAGLPVWLNWDCQPPSPRKTNPPERRRSEITVACCNYSWLEYLVIQSIMRLPWIILTAGWIWRVRRIRNVSRA